MHAELYLYPTMYCLRVNYVLLASMEFFFAGGMLCLVQRLSVSSKLNSRELRSIVAINMHAYGWMLLLPY